MAKFVFVVPPFTGHINPTLSVGKKLIEHGHQVSWIGLKEFLVPEGGTMITLKNRTDAKREDIENILRDSEKGKDIASALASVQFVYADILIPLAKIMMEGVSQALDELQPDLVINDEHAFAGAISSYKKKIPYVTFRTVPADLLDAVFKNISLWISNQILELQRACGIQGNKEIVCSDEMVMVFSSREFTGNKTFPEHYKFVGPVIENRPDIPLLDLNEFINPKLPNVLVSIGTIDRKDKAPFFSKVAAALGDEPLNVIAVADPRLLPEWPKNFIVRSSIPQLSLLPHLSAVICHGGHNTVCEALSFKLPLVVIPMAYDQFHVSTQVVKGGAGLRLKFKRFAVNQLKEATREILRNPLYGIEATKIADSFKMAGGENKVVELIERAVVKNGSLRSKVSYILTGKLS